MENKEAGKGKPKLGVAALRHREHRAASAAGTAPCAWGRGDNMAQQRLPNSVVRHSMLLQLCCVPLPESKEEVNQFSSSSPTSGEGRGVSPRILQT